MYALIFLLYSLTFSIHAAAGDHRCTIDPNGGCVGGLATNDQGSGIDPDGARVRLSTSGDKGLGVDPNG